MPPNPATPTSSSPTPPTLLTNTGAVNPWLGDEAGHGTFVAGIVRQMAPSATIEVRRVPNTDGVGGEVTLARAIPALGEQDRLPHIVNLPLGGYTLDDQCPPIVAAALAGRPTDTVVAVAAGNGESDPPLFPAACNRAIAVGALQNNDDKPAPRIKNFSPEQASYSNSGPRV